MALCILPGTSVCADIPNPDFRGIEPTMSFAGVEDHPDHVFLIHVEDGPSVILTERIIPIPGPEPFMPGFERRIKRVTILAVPKAEYERRRNDAASPFSPESPEVLACEIPSPATSLHVSSPEPDTLRYRVVMGDGKLLVKPVPAKTRNSSSAVPFRSRMAWWGIALAASIAWLGLMVGRRLVRGS
jgi:hypothetical protein